MIYNKDQWYNYVTGFTEGNTCPEIMKKDRFLPEKADVFSLGVILF